MSSVKPPPSNADVSRPFPRSAPGDAQSRGVATCRDGALDDADQQACDDGLDFWRGLPLAVIGGLVGWAVILFLLWALVRAVI